MSFDLVLNKRGTQRVVVGVPDGAQHGISGRIETANGDVIMISEATLAALVEAYMDVVTNPGRQAVEFRAVEDKSPGNDELMARLVQVSSDEAELCRDLAEQGPGELMEGSQDLEDEKEETGEEAPSWSDLSSSVNLADHNPARSVDDGPVFGEEPTQNSQPSPTEGSSEPTKDEPGSD